MTKFQIILNIHFSLIQAAQNQMHTNTRSFTKLVKLKIGTKVMLTVNIHMQNRLLNDQIGIIRHFGFAQCNVSKVYVFFSHEQSDC